MSLARNYAGPGDTLISLSNLVAKQFLPDLAAKAVTSVIPGIIHFLIPASEMPAFLEGSQSATQYVTTQLGKTFKITISESDNPEVFNTIKKAQKARAAIKAGTTDFHTELHAFNTELPGTSKDKNVGSGGVSILNGIIGIQW